MTDAIKQRVQHQFGRAAEAYVVSDVHAQGESLGVLLAELPPRIEGEGLDVATGAGHCALAIAPRLRQVVAADLTEEMLATTARLAADRGVANLTTRRADAEALPFAGGAFDLVTCRLAFHHFPHPQQALAEMARVLRPGGWLGFTDNITVADRQGAMVYNDFERRRDPSHFEVMPLARLIATIEATGLHVTFTRRLTKEFEFHGWCDRQQVSAGDREILLATMRQLPPALTPLFLPRWADDTLYFTLWEAVVVAHKPALS